MRVSKQGNFYILRTGHGTYFVPSTPGFIKSMDEALNTPSCIYIFYNSVCYKGRFIFGVAFITKLSALVFKRDSLRCMEYRKIKYRIIK